MSGNDLPIETAETDRGIVPVMQALDFAARRHASQRRKGDQAEPYLNHLVEVACLLAEATDGLDPALISAGILHDTVEDTPTEFSELEERFGAEVATLVRELTDDKRLPKVLRKQKQVRSAPHTSPRARMIKIADKISNIRSVLDSPPAGWNHRRRRDYIEWASRVVEGCRGVNQRLEQSFDEVRQKALAELF
jgi:guanosine-3',5'-bis(diphosphate) 3'-pyrophosphohydrolase